MTNYSQTQKGANISSVDMLPPKATRRVSCWDVRTLYQTRRLAQVNKEMQSYKIELLGEEVDHGSYSLDTTYSTWKEPMTIIVEVLGSSPPKWSTIVC